MLKENIKIPKKNLKGFANDKGYGLALISTPIGHPDDISLRAIKLLERADVIIGEERKVAAKLLRTFNIKNKHLELLNEHSTVSEIKSLLELCKNNHVALVSDCGTPVFCDPGAELISLCRKNNIPIEIAPGASSLMVFLTGCGVQLKQFYFRGFLPAKTEERELELKNLKKITSPIILMDTPYRLKKIIENLIEYFPERKCIFGLNLTKENEKFLFGTAQEISNCWDGQKAEFMALIL